MAFNGLPSGWRSLTLADLGIITTGKTPSTKVEGYFGGPIPFITPSDMDGRKVIYRTERYLSDLGAESVRSARIPPRAVMVSCIGSDMGKAAVAGRYSVTNQQINSVVVDEKHFFPDFVYYNLSNRKREFQTLAGGGSAQPILNKGHFGLVRISIPPLHEQRAIAQILGALDDQIELNRRMNETLEAMARAIFKSWFVDFDPVRAKAEGRKPFGMDAATAALFPDSFQDSPLGKIPKGWKTGSIGDFVNAVGGSTPRTKEPKFWNGSIHFATPKDMSSLQFPILLETSRRITEEGVQQISSGLLPKGTVLLSSRAPIGYLAVTEIPVAVNQGMIAIICNKGLPNLYVLHWVKENMETIIANANGTTFLEISKANFRPISAIVPSPAVLERFKEAVGPLHRLMVNNENQSRTLTAIRDALLPKLISGEIRLKTAEQLVEENA